MYQSPRAILLLIVVVVVLLLHKAIAIDLPESWGPIFPTYDKRQYQPLPGAAKGSVAALLQVHENVFTSDLLAAMDGEIDAFDKWGTTRTQLVNSKRVTYWRGRDKPARCAIERAVKLLEELTFPAALGGPDAFGIVGCKYWTQKRGPNDEVSFHYDKDEGMASDQMLMKPPPLVGVTHLEDYGAPTVVFNMTTISNGNINFPVAATDAFFVFPKRNKHVIHRGDLYHGANPELAATPVPPRRFRTTIVTSWESEKPLEPNCHEIPDHEMPATIDRGVDWPTFGGLLDAGTGLKLHVPPTLVALDGSSPAQAAAFAAQRGLVVVAHDDGGGQTDDGAGAGALRRQRVRLENKGAFSFFDLTQTWPDPTATYMVSWQAHASVDRGALARDPRAALRARDARAASARAHAPAPARVGHLFIGFEKLDLNNRHALFHLTSGRSTLVLVFYRGRAAGEQALAEAGALAAYSAVYPSNAPGVAPPVKFAFAPAESSGPMMRRFFVDDRDLPTAAALEGGNDDATNRKFVMKEPFGEEAFRLFVAEVVAGKRRPNASAAARKRRRQRRRRRKQQGQQGNRRRKKQQQASAVNWDADVEFI